MKWSFFDSLARSHELKNREFLNKKGKTGVKIALHAFAKEIECFFDCFFAGLPIDERLLDGFKHD